MVMKMEAVAAAATHLPNYDQHAFKRGAVGLGP